MRVTLEMNTSGSTGSGRTRIVIMERFSIWNRSQRKVPRLSGTEYQFDRQNASRHTVCSKVGCTAVQRICLGRRIVRCKQGIGRSGICKQWEHGCWMSAESFKYYSQWSCKGHSVLCCLEETDGLGNVGNFDVWRNGIGKAQLRDHRIERSTNLQVGVLWNCRFVGFG